MLGTKLTELQTWIVDNAATDPVLRTRLLSDPVGTVRSEWPEFGLDDGVELQCIEQGAGVVHLVVPNSYRSDAEPDPTTSPLEYVLHRVVTDGEFKKNLVRDPMGTFATLEPVGLRLPQGTRLMVHEETSSKHFVVLPHADAVRAMLTDDELEHVAGGFDGLAGYSSMGGCSCGCANTGCCSTNSNQNTCHGMDLGGGRAAGLLSWNTVNVGPVSPPLPRPPVDPRR